MENKKLWWAFWILVIGSNYNNHVACSGKGSMEASGGKSKGLWGYVTSLASAVLMVKVDNEVNYGKLFQFERDLQDKLKDMGTALSRNPALIPEGAWNPIKFPEASAFSALFIRDVGGHLDTWMDLSETKKLHENSRIVSQHILWVRSVGTRAATSYFIYRPSFEAELESSNILPHLKYHNEASETAQKVIDIVQQYPNDQIVFAGLQSGGIIAMLHAWMVTATVPIVYYNLKEFEGELHQVKVFLFDSDCALSESYAPNFPIPSWDVLRFYSGMGGTVSPDHCRFESMKPIGLAYSFKPSWSEYLLSSSIHVDRTKFVDYYDKSMGMENARQSSSENIDNGIEEAFDENASIAESEISMSVDGNAYQPRAVKAAPGIPIKNFEEIIRPGIELLRQSMSLAKFFYNNLKEIYRTHQTFYLRRNVAGCAAAMQKNLINTLMGNERESPIVEKGIKDVSCQVDTYNEKTKVAAIVCTLEGKDGVKISNFRFRTHVQNKMESTLSERRISVVENEWEEISMTGRSVSTSESYAVSGRPTRKQVDEDVFYDDRTHVTGFQEKAQQWAMCLDELFRTVPHLNFITPLMSNGAPSSASSIGTSSKNSPGSSTLSIQLPFSSTTAVCEYSLLTLPKNFYQLYSVSSSMFFSIFSDVIETSGSPPASCNGILEPPSIAHKNSGNAETFSRILNGYFNSDGVSQISHKQTIVNGLELQESITNLPSNNPYEIFNQPLCNLLAECLAQNVIENLYDCNSHLTLWAGKHHCPEVCRYRPSALGSRPLHLCSRVVNCGEGVFLGFRGCKTFGSERPLSEEFLSHSVLNRFSPAAYYAAFHLKHVDGWSASLKKPFRFAVFLSEAAHQTFIANSNQNEETLITNPAPSSASITSNSLKKKTTTIPSTLHAEYDEDELADEDIESDYYNYGQRRNEEFDAAEEFEGEEEFDEPTLKEVQSKPAIIEEEAAHTAHQQSDQQLTDQQQTENQFIITTELEDQQDQIELPPNSSSNSRTLIDSDSHQESHDQIIETLPHPEETKLDEKSVLLTQLQTISSFNTGAVNGNNGGNHSGKKDKKKRK